MSTPAVEGAPRILLRAEGAALLAAATILYAKTGTSWWLFAALFLAPDLSLLGYLAGPVIGASTYNAAHTTMAPLLLAVAGLWSQVDVLLPPAMIWLAHIGFDRTLGYGLKYEAGFVFTHLGRLGDVSKRGGPGT